MLASYYSDVCVSTQQTDGHYPEVGNDQLYNPYTEVLVLSGGCVSSVCQISLVDENK